MQLNHLNQFVELEHVVFQYNAVIQYRLHPTVVVESMNKVCTHCKALKFKNEIFMILKYVYGFLKYL